MKTHAMTSGLRITLSKTELQALLTLARYGAEQLAATREHYTVPKREETVVPDIIKGLDDGLTSLRWKQAEARERRDAPRREAERRAAREHHAMVDGHTVWATLGDWTDVSDDPDERRWADLLMPGTEPREQAELRRNVWRIFVTKGSAASDDFTVFPGDCTETADRGEIEQLARRIIAKHRK